MTQELATGFSGVVLLARGQRVVFLEGYGLADRKSRTPVRHDTIFDAGSLSKQVTSAAAVLLESQGKLSLDDPLSHYFPSVPADKAAITIVQLLSHTSGLHSWALPNDFVPVTQDQWLDIVFSKPLEHASGSKYRYSNDGFTLVAMIIEKVAQQPYRKFVKGQFFEPLGMQHSGWYDDAVFKQPGVSLATGYRNGKDDGSPDEWPGPYWALLGNGGILWNAADLFKWHNALHGKLLPESARQKLFTPIADTGQRHIFDGEEPAGQYALGWSLARTSCGDLRIGHTGAGITHNVDYRYYRARDLLLYVASNKLEANYSGEELFFSRRAANSIARAIFADCSRETKK
jgi:CubicO group peptidase (beta-lactamase class C family)